MSMPKDKSELRERVYRYAIALSVVFVADGIFMGWALMHGAYAFLGYGKFSYIPVFFPAMIAGLVVSGIYVYGFMRLSWVARKAEWLFFFLFTDAVAAKIIVVIHRHCCG
jgi:hypothetical protein